MRIGVVHSFYRSNSPSGENIAVMAQVDALKRAGHSVKLFSQDSDVEINGIKDMVRAGIRVATGFGIHPIKSLESSSVDIVHVHNLFPNWSTQWLKSLEVPYVATVHNFRYICASGTLSRDGRDCDLCPKHGSVHSLIHQCYKGSAFKTIPLAIATRRGSRPTVLEHAARIVFLSERSAATFKKLGLGYPEKSSIVPNFSQFREKTSSVELQKKHPCWLYVGRLSDEKGILPLIEKWPTRRSLVVIGDGPLRMSCELAAAGKNIVFTGHLQKHDIENYLGSSTGLVFPSQVRENSPLSYLEALSFGLPVISLRENSVGDDITRNGCGVVLDTFENLERAIEKIEANHSHYRNLSLAASKNFYSEETWVTKIEEIYNECRR